MVGPEGDLAVLCFCFSFGLEKPTKSAERLVKVGFKNSWTGKRSYLN